MNMLESSAMKEMALLNHEGSKFRELSLTTLAQLQLKHDAFALEISQLNGSLTTTTTSISQYSVLSDKMKEQAVELSKSREVVIGEYQKAIEQSEGRAKSVLEDLEHTIALSQQVAELSHQYDLYEMVESYTNLVKKIHDKPKDLQETCKSREELSGAINQLLHVLQKSHDHEVASKNDLLEQEKASLVEIDAQIDSFQKQPELSRQKTLLEMKQEELTKKIEEISKKQQEVDDTLTSMVQMQDWMARSIIQREAILTESVEQAKSIIHLITLLQAKAAVRAVSTQ
jgi:hypothetical protein